MKIRFSYILKMPHAIICAIFILLLPQDASPMAKMPRQANKAGDKSVHSPLLLQDCYQLALKRSETVAIQKEIIKQTEAEIFIAISQAVGTVNYEMNQTTQSKDKNSSNSSIASAFSQRHQRERKFVIEQPLFQGFKSLGAIIGAGNFKNQRSYEYLRAQQLLFDDVVSAFYDVFYRKKDLETLQELHKALQERIMDLTNREKIGRSRLSEVVSTEARQKTLESDIAQAKGALEISKFILEFLLGTTVSEQNLKDEVLRPKPTEKLEEYLKTAETRDDVQAALQSAKTAWQGVVVAQSDFWPNITFQSNQYEKREGISSGIDWDMLFKIDVPIFQGGKNFGNFKESVSLWKQAKLVHSQTLRSAELDIKQSYQNWIVSFEQNKALHEALAASEENYNLQLEDFHHNLVDNFEVLDALETLYTTQRNTNQSDYALKKNYWKLKVATGEAL